MVWVWYRWDFCVVDGCTYYVMKPVRLLDRYVIFEAPPQVASLFPGVRYSEPWAAVELNLENAVVLRNLGYECPSPIRSTYPWPMRRGRSPRWYQQDTAEFFTLNKRAFCLNSMRCVDAETEYLTRYGWNKIDQYCQGEEIAQWNPNTDQAEFVVPTEYIVTPCTKFIHFKTTKGIDQMLTPEHRMPFYNDRGELEETKAWLVHNANLNTRGWRGKIPVTFVAPERVGLALTDNQIRLMVAVIADGYFAAETTTHCTIRVKKERKKIRLRELLKANDLEYKEIQKDYVCAVGFSKFIFYAPLRHKTFSSMWWNATSHQLDIIIDEVRYWDSSLRRDKGSFSFSTAIRESADFIQYAAAATKHQAMLHVQTRNRRNKIETEYYVNISSNSNPIGMMGVTGDGFKIVNSKIVPVKNALCYCFSVPSTYIILRRNGKIFITGNTGKTNSALWAADYLMKEGYIRKALISSPLSTLERVWGDTLFIDYPHRKYSMLYGSASKRRDLLNQDSDFYIINHDGIGILKEQLQERQDIDLIIFDEVAVFRNKETSRWGAAKSITKPNQWIWGLTGTPTPNAPTDAYGQMKLIKPENYNGAFTRFKQHTMVQVGPFKWTPRVGAEESVKQILQPSIRFTRDVCTDMEVNIIEREAELSKEQAYHYKKLINEAVTYVGSTQVTAVNAAVLLSKLVQTACGVVYGANGQIAEMDFGPRLKIVEELIEENDEKVLLFVPFTGVLDALAEKLRKRWSVAVVDGGVPAAKRNRIFKDFQNEKNPHVIAAHPGTMAHGLDLTAASLIIWYAPHVKNEEREQANARIDGSAQKAKMDIANIFATKEERQIYRTLQEKGRLQDIILQMIKKG